MDVNDIRRRLHSINWNFDFNISYSSTSLNPFDCRKHYSYPATFIPEIPFSLIETLTKKGDIVLDPFGGIGTTFIQSLLLERIPFSCDINPIATNVCSAFYDLFNPDLDRKALESFILSRCDDYCENRDYTSDITPLQKNLRGWYAEETFNRICYLFLQYERISGIVEKNIMKLVVSGILSTLSSQNKGWAYIADNVKPKADEYKNKPVFETYRSRTKLLFFEVESHLKNCPNSFRAFYCETKKSQRIFNNSIINTNIPVVNAIITSPPYPRMIDYVKSQRMALDFQNERYNDYTEFEIGARCHRAQKEALQKYSDSMKKINNHLCNLLALNGYLCLVLPDYPMNDARKPIIETMIKTYEEQGLKIIDEFNRYIPSNRRSISIQWASLVNEKIIILRKER